MRVAILTVGDEILSGDTTNTNASWLAARLTDRGVTVARILTIPDDESVIARYVSEFADDFDAVVVTGGIGATPDDVTVEAVARALDRELVVDEAERDRMLEAARAFRAENPDLVAENDFDTDLDAAASLPEGARTLSTDVGWAPGCAVENIYVLPGIPDEMKAMFELVADEFAGDQTSETLYTPTPEGALGDVLDQIREEFDVAVGSYPTPIGTPGRLHVTGTDEDEVAAAVAWLEERVETTDPPE